MLRKPMIKKKAVPVSLTAVVAAILLLSGCFKNIRPAQTTVPAVPSGDVASQTEDPSAGNDGPTQQTVAGRGVKKVYSFKTAFDPLSDEAKDNALPSELLRYDGGFVYTDETGKRGVLSPDFRHDSGAVYAQVQPRGDLFMVTEDASVYTPETLNRFSLVSAQGKELLSAQYADFFVTGNFVAALKATGPASRSGGALLTYTNLQFLAPEERENTNESKVYYQGEWQLYDLLTMMPVPQATGTAPGKWAAHGKYVSWTDARGRYNATTALGATLPAGAQLLDSGDYSLTENTIATVYTPEGEKLFSYDPQDYTLKYNPDYGVYYCVGKTQNGNRAYSFFLLDENGVRAPGTYESKTANASFVMYGKYLYTDARLYYNGKLLGSGRSAVGGWLDTDLGRGAYICTEGKNDEGVKCRTYAYYDAEGAFLAEAEDPLADLRIDGFFIPVDEDDTAEVYVFQTGECVPVVSKVGDWFACVPGEKEGTNDLIDILTGETLLSGYEAYRYLGAAADAEAGSEGRVPVICAFSGGTADVYTVNGL